MSALLRAELLKLRTTRTFIALVATSTLLSLGLTIVVAVKGTPGTPEDVRDFFNIANPSALLALILGAIGMTGEWRHRTITSTVLAAPDRVRLLAAKTLSHALAGLVLALVVTSVIMLAGLLILSSRGAVTLGAADIADVLWRNLVIAALFGALGVGIGAVARNQAATVVGITLVLFFLEPVLVQALPDVGRFGPLSGAPNGILGGFDLPKGELLAPAAAAAVLIGWVVAAFATGATLLRRRDLV
jgi:ABC-type transport system involved in multi-copper enzyme maturation permease subunit